MTNYLTLFFSFPSKSTYIDSIMVAHIHDPSTQEAEAGGFRARVSLIQTHIHTPCLEPA